MFFCFWVSCSARLTVTSFPLTFKNRSRTRALTSRCPASCEATTTNRSF
jgi:hypothetical protein